MINSDMNRLESGEGWVICKECMVKLYSYDGYRDIYHYPVLIKQNVKKIQLLKISDVNKEELIQKEEELTKQYQMELNRLRKKYVNENSKFNVGEFVGNVTGIIKVDTIHYRHFMNDISITYKGLRYKKVKGKLYRTKDNKPTVMVEDNIKRIDCDEE
jgi:hypothetical protein